jgi:hypothetical protein
LAIAAKLLRVTSRYPRCDERLCGKLEEGENGCGNASLIVQTLRLPGKCGQRTQESKEKLSYRAQGKRLRNT